MWRRQKLLVELESNHSNLRVCASREPKFKQPKNPFFKRLNKTKRNASANQSSFRIDSCFQQGIRSQWKHEIVGTHVLKTSKFGKWKIVRPENSQKLSRTSSGKTTARIVERTARIQSRKKRCRKATGWKPELRFKDQPVKITVTWREKQFRLSSSGWELF